jgi:hypothetical protein
MRRYRKTTERNRCRAAAIFFVLGLALLGLTTVGCGGGGDKIVFTKQVNEQIADYEYARSVNLRAEDLPGMEAVGREEEATATTGTVLGLGGCRFTHLTGVRGFYSPRWFSREPRSVSLGSTGRDVGSAVITFPNQALPTADRILRGPAFRDCLRRADDRHERFSAGHFESLKAIPTLLSGVRSFGSRAIVVHVERGKFSRGRRYTEYEDLLGFLLGRAEVLELTDSRGAPFPAKQEHGLLALLYSRARKARAP